jgi:hypothetical protein
MGFAETDEGKQLINIDQTRFQNLFKGYYPSTVVDLSGSFEMRSNQPADFWSEMSLILEFCRCFYRGFLESDGATTLANINNFEVVEVVCSFTRT